MQKEPTFTLRLSELDRIIMESHPFFRVIPLKITMEFQKMTTDQLRNLREYADAEDYLKKALHILENLSESEIETAITYTNLAVLYMEENRLDEAETHLKKALDIFITESGDRDVHYAAAISALGELHFMRGDYTSAASDFEKALALNIRDYGENTDTSRTLAANLQLCREKLKGETL